MRPSAISPCMWSPSGPTTRDGPWLYVEQSLTDAPDHPYKQHIYQLAARADGALGVRILDLPDSIAVTGTLENPRFWPSSNPPI